MMRLGEEILAFVSDRRFPLPERLEMVELGVAALRERLKEHFPPEEPEEGEAEEPPEDISPLLEEPLPEDFAPLVERLRRWAEEEALFFPSGFQPGDAGPGRIDLDGVSLPDLLSALEEVWERARARERLALPVRRLEFGEALRAILKLLRTKERVPFSELFPPEADRSTVVATFVALLELWRRGRVKVLEDGGEIAVSRRP